MKFENANVLITGGASGIGKTMGRMALERGAKHNFTGRKKPDAGTSKAS